MSLEISVTGRPPDLWEDHLTTCRGSFFHSPAALAVSLPPGRPMFVELRSAAETVAMALGVARRCALGGGARHLYFASSPAVSPGNASRWEAARAMARFFGEHGATELTLDSFGDGGLVAPEDEAQPLRARREYVVGLDRGRDELLASFSSSHRRYARRGKREEWRFRRLTGAEALDRLFEVQEVAATRGNDDTRRFRPSKLRPEALDAFSAPDRSSGLAVYGAFVARRLLAAALVGWGGGRGFYLQGGSTEEGYDRYTSIWLHWRMMLEFREAGIHGYNLGGTPAAASESGHDQHGLHRYKARFNGEEVHCRGARWTLAPVHMGVHRLVRACRQIFPGTSS